MADDHGTVRTVAWFEVFPALRLLAAVRMALNLKALLLAALAITGTVAGWRVAGQVFSSDRPQTAVELTEPYGSHSALFPSPETGPTNLPPPLYRPWPWDYLAPQPPAPRFRPPSVAYETVHAWIWDSPLVLAWHELAAPFVRMYEAPSLVGFVHLMCCGLWTLAVWSLFGGAITRQAAVAFARHENVSLVGLARFTSPRWTAYFVAPLFPILGTFLIGGMLAVLGLLMRAEVGILVAGILWPLVLLGGFMMTFLLVGLFFGFPLMWSAVSVEGTDYFGALSHSYSYVYQRPAHYLLYGISAAIVGVLGWYLVWLFVPWIIELVFWGVSWGRGVGELTPADPEAANVLGNAGRALIAFWTHVLYALAFGFIFSYFWSASTVIYFLLRRAVDGKELDQVYMPDEPQPHGLPPLKTGPDGVPAVVDEPAEAAENATA